MSSRFFSTPSVLSDTLVTIHPIRTYPSPNDPLRKVTGIVGDILRNKRALQYAKAWRSDVNVLTITQLMMRLWVAEEARLGVSRPNGVLRNLWQPLHSHELRTGYKSKGIDPSTRESFIRDPTNAASDDRFFQTSLGVEGEVASLAPKDGVEIPENGILAGESGEKEEISGRLRMSEDQKAISGEHLAIAFALHASKPVISAGQRCSTGRRASSIDASVSKATRQLDLRSKIAAVLERIGVDGSVKDVLGPNDLKAFYMATSYLGFRKGEAWQEVKLSSRVKCVEFLSGQNDICHDGAYGKCANSQCLFPG